VSNQLDIDFPEGNSLPPGWAEATLVSLVADQPNAMTDGPFGSKLKSAHYTEAGVRVIRLGNLGVGEFKDKDRSFVSEEHAATLSKHAVEAGDLLIAALAEPVGRCCRVPSKVLPAIVKADCIRFRPHPSVSPAFLMHWMNSPIGRKNAEHFSHGVGRLRINMKNMRVLPVRIAPLPEQRRIVAEIETQFTRLDAAVSTLKRVQVNLKRARASVLKAAVEGRLVPTEAQVARAEGRASDPASVLLERILDERRRKHDEAQVGAKRKKKYKPPVEPDTDGLPELPEGWVWTSCDAVGEILLGRQRAPQYLTGEWSRPYLRVANIKDDRIDFADVKEMDFDPDHFARYALQPEDILVSEGQSPELVGQSAIYSGGHDGLCFQKTLHRWRPVRGGPSSRYAQTVFRAWVRLRVFMARASITTNIAHLTLTKFRHSPFPLPPLAEQDRIVAKVERRLSVLDALEQTVQRNLLRCTALRQSILKRAFEGRLVPQDSTDEPASELLARIGATS